MQRREFIGLLGGAAATWPIPARGQQPDRMRRIGVLMGYSENDPETKARLAAFRQGLEQRGWSEGRNIRIDYRLGAPAASSAMLAKELVALQPDLIFAQGPTQIAAVHRESSTRFQSCSLVLPIRLAQASSRAWRSQVGDADRSAAVRGGCCRQVASDAQGDRTAPRARCVRWPTRRRLPTTTSCSAALALAPSLAMELVPSPVDDAADIERAIVAFARVPDGGLILPAGLDDRPPSRSHH